MKHLNMSATDYLEQENGRDSERQLRKLYFLTVGTGTMKVCGKTEVQQEIELTALYVSDSKNDDFLPVISLLLATRKEIEQG